MPQFVVSRQTLKRPLGSAPRTLTTKTSRFLTRCPVKRWRRRPCNSSKASPKGNAEDGQQTVRNGGRWTFTRLGKALPTTACSTWARAGDAGEAEGAEAAGDFLVGEEVLKAPASEPRAVGERRASGTSAGGLLCAAVMEGSG